MKTVSRYMMREVLANAGLGLLLFTFVIFMRDIGRLLEIVVRNSSVSPLQAFAYVLPSALVFTIPMGVLVGILIGLGRMGADNELTAMRAAGLSVRQLLQPLLTIVGGALLLALVTSLWLAPHAASQLFRLEAGLASSQISFEVQPRVFIENIPNAVVYVGDVQAGGRLWRKVFVADMKDATTPRITMAERGQIIQYSSDTVQLHLENGVSYDSSNNPENLLVSSFISSDLPLQVPPARTGSASPQAMTTGELWYHARFANDWRLARIELHRRLALAFACISLTLVGIPLGLRARKGGKATGFVLTILLVFVYYIVLITGLGLARQGRVPPWLGVWAADFLCAAAGLWLIRRVDRVPRVLSRGVDPVAMARNVLARWLRRREEVSVSWGGAWLPTLIDGYVVREFLGYVGLMLASFLVLLLVFTFFELLGDMVRTHAGAQIVAKYLLYLSPQLLYLMIPVAMLVGVLVTFGLMSKANEVTALKACGVSAYRLLIPVLLVSAVLAFFQFGLDESYLPRLNRKQDALRAEIKGRPPQTHQRPARKWMFGRQNNIYYFQLFDPLHQEFANLSIFSFDPAQFQLTRRIYARAAHWDDHIQGWVLEQGWVRELSGADLKSYQTFRVASFNDIREKPSYFTSEVSESTQMNYTELARYIHELKTSGYDVSRLTVQLEKKLSYPLITVIMGLLAFPFSMTVGRKGAVTGIAVAIGVAILYWVSSGFLEAMGNLNQLPALLAAWAPDALFAIAGGYLLLRVPT